MITTTTTTAIIIIIIITTTMMIYSSIPIIISIIIITIVIGRTSHNDIYLKRFDKLVRDNIWSIDEDIINPLTTYILMMNIALQS